MHTSSNENYCSGRRPSRREMQLAQKIGIIVLRMAKRSVSDFPCFARIEANCHRRDTKLCKGYVVCNRGLENIYDLIRTI